MWFRKTLKGAFGNILPIAFGGAIGAAVMSAGPAFNAPFRWMCRQTKDSKTRLAQHPGPGQKGNAPWIGDSPATLPSRRR